MDDVGRRLTSGQQKAVCAFFDAVTAVIERKTDEPGPADDPSTGEKGSPKPESRRARTPSDLLGG
jgi:hypothetical protein